MEIEGIKIDNKFLKLYLLNLKKKLKKFKKKFLKYQKKNLILHLQNNLEKLLYNDLKNSRFKKTKKGSFATSASVLEDLAFKGHKFPKLVLDWRQVSKLKNTYSDSLPEHINPKQKEFILLFYLRQQLQEDWLQVILIYKIFQLNQKMVKILEKHFIAEKDQCLISADYNQIEMRILADLADVKELKKAFKNNEDIHSLTASQIFNIDIKKVNQDQRRKAKAINFGIIYGISQYGLAKQINVSNYEAEEFLNAYFAKFPEIKIYMDQTIKFCRKSGYVNNIFGRRSHFININDKNYNVRNFQERAAINAPIQGSASEIMRLAMIRLDKKLREEKSKN